MTQLKINVARRATEKAKQILKTGDLIKVSRCAGETATYTFSHWGGEWIISQCDESDIHAVHILEVNGRPVDFKSSYPPRGEATNAKNDAH